MQIYNHIPFCEQKCGYCRFASVWKIQNLHIAKYVDFLCKEIKKIWTSDTNKNSPIIPFLKGDEDKNKQISTIYFGWGTPGVLSLKQLEKIFIALKSKFIFSDNIEISLESTPDKITKQNLIGWERLWINRLSMWVQTLNQKSLEAIWRGNKWDIEKALKALTPSPSSLREREIKNISIDFIIWLPYVVKWEIKKDIEYILKKYDFIKHISVYMLEDYYNPDKIIETQYDNITYPDDWWKMWIAEEDYLEEYSEVKTYLKSEWFTRYEISNYAKPWFECKHNKWYWNHSEVIWFGLWAYWFVDKTRYANSEKFSEYYQWKKILETKLNSEDIFLETVMFQLRTSWVEQDICKKLNKERLEFFLREWYLEKKSDKIMLLDKWVLVMDYILKEIV